MNDDERSGDGTVPDDEALARVRAADPAAGLETPLGELRARVDARLAADGAEAPGAQVEAEAAEPDELAARRRRRTPWLAVAGVAALAVVGGGGYLLGGASALGAADAGGGSAAAPITLNGGPRGDQAAAGAEASAGAALGAAEDSAAADTAGASAGASTLPSWYSSGRALFRADGLSTEAGTATAYALDATDAATREGAARVAAALDVEGEPRWESGWAVGPGDGDGPHVWLSVDGSATFSYSSPDLDPWRCEEDLARSSEEGTGDGAVEGDVADCETPSTSTVGDREARGALADAMRSLGVDPEDFEIEVGERSEGDPARWVTAYQVVDGTRTGAQWSATVGEKGIAWLDGFLATTTDLGEYPVVSAAEAVERLGDPRFSGSAWPVVYAEEEMAAEVYEEPTEPTSPPSPPAAGDPVDWPVSEVEITDARLGLAQQAQDDGSVVLVPAYELSDADGNAWSVVAVADDAMDFSAPR
ncbi:hypothetical protein M1843_15605 [Isoptericola sp. 4D.3]|uniref:Uncharacterized protein n=1 Tax=Isoptericola peretonis TaxID=2918523 RepID=A0ABT0J6Q1_9MICO|nr:hypothetical protein [Isoptericola sp. 4D.3]